MNVSPSRTRLAGRAVMHMLLSVLFSYAFYERYWKWRECIVEALSSCVTPGGENLIGGGVFWVVPASLFLLLFLRAAVRFMSASESGKQ